MAKKRRGGKGFAGRIGVFFVVLIALFTWFKLPAPIDPDNPMDHLQAKSNSISEWAKKVEREGLPALLDGINFDSIGDGSTGGGFGGGTGGSGSSGGTTGGAPSSSDVKAATKSLGKLKVAEAQSVNYNRDDWNHWVNAPGTPSCWNVRDEVLWRDSDKSTLVLLDGDNKPTTDKSKACKVQAGKWVDPYSGKTFTDPSKIDIDHMVPLSYTAQHGGQDWSKSKKEDYANSLDNPRHLLATSASENRSKGDKGPSKYQPKVDQCRYATDWISVSAQWKLTTAAADKKALEEMLATC